MQDTPAKSTPAKKSPKAHEEKYRNDPPLEHLPHEGEKRGETRSPKDLTAGRIDERRGRPAKESHDE